MLGARRFTTTQGDTLTMCAQIIHQCLHGSGIRHELR
jgi:hypothetical protein